MSSTASKPKGAKPRQNLLRVGFSSWTWATAAVLTSNPDGSDLKTIVSEGRELPDGIVVDVAAGHIYWTNMGNPSSERWLHRSRRS